MKYRRAPKAFRQATALTLALLLCALPATAGITIRGTQGVTMTDANGIYYDNTSGLTLTGADNILGLQANGIFLTQSNGLTLTGADGQRVVGVDGVSYTGSNTYTAARVDGLTLTGADGLTLTGVDGLTLTGADGNTYQADTVILRQPAGLTLTGADGLTLTGVDGLQHTGPDGLTLTGADGLTLTGVDRVEVNSAGEAVVTTTDGRIISVTPNGLTLTGVDGLTLTGADGVSMYGVQGLTLTGADGLAASQLDAATGGQLSQLGLMSFDPELAKKLDCLTDDSNVNAVIVYHRAVTDADIADLERLGVRGGTRYRALPMVAVTASKQQIDQIADLPTVLNISDNRTLQWDADNSQQQTGLVRARADADLLRVAGGAPFEGEGVTVAVLDTGVDATHADLAGRVVRNVKLADLQGLSLVGFNPPQNVEGLPTTDQASGHGTFVAGVIAGGGASSGGKYKGYAPRARVVGLSAGDASLLNVLAGFDYLLTHPELGVRVVNCSFSSNTVYDPLDAVNVATRLLVERGTNVVFSAGNSGSGMHSLNPYAAAPWVISVGAVDGRGRLAGFSSRGDFGSRNFRPTLVAPGVEVVSLRAAGTNLTGTTGVVGGADTTHLAPSELQHYTTASGTSFSAPQVAGTIALMLEANPRLTTAQVRDILQRSATPMPPYYQHEVGAGALNAHAAVLEAAFPERQVGLFRAVLNRGQVRFYKEPDQIFEGEVMPGGTHTVSLKVPASAVFASTQIAWGPMTSVNDLALDSLDPSGTVRGESNFLNLPGLTGRRERTLVNMPAAGTWRARVTHTFGLGASPQSFKGVFETARVEYAPTADTAGLAPSVNESVRQSVRAFAMWPDADGLFRPGALLSRFELAAGVVAAGRVPQYVPATPSFTDVSDATTLNFVESAQSLFPDVVRGGPFHPDERVSRLLAAIVLVRAAGLEAEAQSRMNATLRFTDADDIPDEWRGHVYVATQRGLISAGERFNPTGAFSRAGLAQALAAIVKLPVQ